jgi:glucokinase
VVLPFREVRRTISRVMRVIAGDVGGTKTLLRCVEPSGEVSAEERYESPAWRTFGELVTTFLAKCPRPIESACFAVAGPVLGNRATVTNVGWDMSCEELQALAGVRRVRLVNDFYAVAVGVPLLGPGDLLSLQAGERNLTSPIGIVGAGTGLGEAVVIPDGTGWVVVPTEGGHQDFAPQDEQQARLFLALHAKYGHVSWERLVSGMGLVNIFTFLGGDEIDPAEIAAAAESGDERARKAVAIFVDLYGAEAGNMALRVLARGGVFLSGGIAAKNQAWFTDGRFIEAFRRKGRFAELMATIPVDLITNESVGLIGAVEIARRA